jgi:menaquinone-dependent protoporphyrinogen oxidase
VNTLVAAASRHGATWGIAEALTHHLTAAGHTVSTRKPRDVEALDAVEVVVLGSAVYAGRWLTDAYDFVHRFRTDLVARHVWLFSSGPPGNVPMTTELDIDDVIAMTQAREHTLFWGCIDRCRITSDERRIVQTRHIPTGDFRDFQAIAQWAWSIDAQLERISARA